MHPDRLISKSHTPKAASSSAGVENTDHVILSVVLIQLSGEFSVLTFTQSGATRTPAQKAEKKKPKDSAAFKDGSLAEASKDTDVGGSTPQGHHPDRQRKLPTAVTVLDDSSTEASKDPGDDGGASLGLYPDPQPNVSYVAIAPPSPVANTDPALSTTVNADTARTADHNPPLGACSFPYKSGPKSRSKITEAGVRGTYSPKVKKMMTKMGHKNGQGLGRRGDGRLSPIRGTSGTHIASGATDSESMVVGEDGTIPHDPYDWGKPGEYSPIPVERAALKKTTAWNSPQPPRRGSNRRRGGDRAINSSSRPQPEDITTSDSNDGWRRIPQGDIEGFTRRPRGGAAPRHLHAPVSRRADTDAPTGATPVSSPEQLTSADLMKSMQQFFSTFTERDASGGRSAAAQLASSATSRDLPGIEPRPPSYLQASASPAAAGTSSGGGSDREEVKYQVRSDGIPRPVFDAAKYGKPRKDN